MCSFPFLGAQSQTRKIEVFLSIFLGAREREWDPGKFSPPDNLSNSSCLRAPSKVYTRARQKEPAARSPTREKHLADKKLTHFWSTLCVCVCSPCVFLFSQSSEREIQNTPHFLQPFFRRETSLWIWISPFNANWRWVVDAVLNCWIMVITVNFTFHDVRKSANTVNHNFCSQDVEKYF